MFGSAYRHGPSTPTHFKENARNTIYQQLPSVVSGSASIRSAPSKTSTHTQKSNASSIFSKLSGKRARSVRSAPSLYSSSTATIPEDAEPISTTVEQLVNDIVLHETYLKENRSVQSDECLDGDEVYKISLGSELQYQQFESLVDWNLNVTRCKLILVQLPMMSSVDSFRYSQNVLPQLVGDLAQLCQIVLIQPHITDKELIYTLVSSNLYEEHELDVGFKKSVAEISVKQSRLLQINERTKGQAVSVKQSLLKFKFKEIAIRNYLVNLAAAATTAKEYKEKVGEMRGGGVRLSREEKRGLWEGVRGDVFRRAGLE